MIGYDAVGNGGRFALGAFYATQSLEMALQAAAYHSSDTRPPFLFVTTEGADHE